MHKVARDEGLDKVMDLENLDVVFAPMDSPICTLSTASGKQVPFTWHPGYLSTHAIQVSDRHRTPGEISPQR